MLALVLAGAGCGRGEQAGKDAPAPVAPAPAVRTSAAAPTALPAAPLGDADLLAGVPVGAAVTNTELAAADVAWNAILTAMRPPERPAGWSTNPPSKEVEAEFRKKVGESAAQTAGLARDFYTKFPKHENAPEARDREHYLLNAAVQLGYTNAQGQLEALEEVQLKDPKLPEEERLQLRIQQVQRTAFKMGGADNKAVLAELEKGARAILKEFPKRPEAAGILAGLAEGWLEQGDAAKARQLATEIRTDDLDEEGKASVDGLLKKLDRLGKPIEIKYTAIDGRAVDLQALKGKVVLLDFWATWCVPCVQELPKVKAAYEKLHDKGFEIVAISLDRELDALKQFVAREKMPWPQFFDSTEEGSKFAEQFSIASIPTMWLIDKKGNLRDLNAREDLAGKVEKLLAE